jgi:non-heme chloroperoxidase
VARSRATSAARHEACRQGRAHRRRAAGAGEVRSNPEGTPLEVFDGLRAALASDRAQFYKEFAIPFFGVNRPGAKVSQGTLDQFFRLSMQAG